MSSDTWGSRSHSNRNVDDNQLTTTTITSLGANNANNNTNTNTNTNPNIINKPSTNIPNNIPNNNPTANNPELRRPAYHNNYRRNPRHSHKRSRSRSFSRSRSRSHSRSMNVSMSRSPTPKKRGPPSGSNRHNDHNRKRNAGGGSRPYHSRRPKRHTRELPYPSRSRSSSKSRSSKSRSPSYSNDSDDARRHRDRRHNRKSRPLARDNRYKHRHGHRPRDNIRGPGGGSGSGSGGGGRYNPLHRDRGGKDPSHNENGNAYNRNDRRGATYKKSTQSGNSASNSDKVPVSFKEFTNTMLEDDVTAQEAQKRYEKYLQRFSKSDDVLFFEAHKDEEWFQERYDPIIIEKSIESRRQNARNNNWKFYQEFLADDLPQIHDNIADFTAVPKTIKPPSPSPAPSNEEGEQEPDDKDDANGDVSMKNQSKPTVTVTVTTTSTTSTTTIGTADSAQSMDVDHSNAANNGKYDGKLRLPKYADIMYRDDYEPRVQRMSEYHSHAHNSNRNECYQNSIFIQGIPLHIQREKILTPFAKCAGFCKLILSDPIRNSRKVRYGWVTFDGQENCRKALLDVGEGGLNGHQLTGQYFMNLLPKQKSKRRPKFSPPESLYPHRVDLDIAQTLQCCKKFDVEAGIADNALLQDKLLNNLSVIRRLNVLLLYLRRIHFLCYYCGKHFLSEEHMFARCSGTHERKVPADPSLAMSGNIDIDSQTTNIIKKEKTNWEKDLDQRINDVLNYVIDHKHCWIERKQVKMLEKNSKKVSEGKFRCTICSKLFKAQIYVTKHIKNKHQDEIAKYIADQRLRTMFENYRRDRDRLTVRSFEDNEDKRDGHGHKREGKMSAPVPFGKGGVMHHGHRGQMKGNVMHNPHAAHAAPQMFAGAAMPLHPHPPPRGPMPPHLMMAPYGHIPPPNYPYVRPPGPPTPVGSERAAQFAPPQNGNGSVGVGVGNSAVVVAGAMHPERASNIAGLHPQAKQGAPVPQPHGSSASLSISPSRGGGVARGGFYGHGRGRGGGIGGRGVGVAPLRSSMYDDGGDPYGRKIPVHFQEPATRTRRSYREVDIEYPVDEVEEEIDYGFGDFVKNPTKFNL